MEGPGMVYDVHATNEDGSEARFEWQQDEPVKVGAYVNAESTSYRVMRILRDETDRYDAVVEAEWRMGPPVTGYTV
jgi:hypothetical protein